jgi:Flp pilus assembly secretin CpaC
MKRWLPILSLLAMSWGIRAAEPALPAEVSLSVGESVLLLADVRRAALGSGKVISIAVPERGQLLLFGEAAGSTTAQLWLRDGSGRPSFPGAWPAGWHRQHQCTNQWTLRGS